MKPRARRVAGRLTALPAPNHASAEKFTAFIARKTGKDDGVVMQEFIKLRNKLDEVSISMLDVVYISIVTLR